MSEPRPLLVYWRRRTLDLVPESYFIHHVLLGAIGRPLRVVPLEQLGDADLVDGGLVVSLKTEAAPLLAQARQRGLRRVMLWHLGDEHGRDDRAFYADAALVLRNYWFDDIQSDPKVVWVPNGYGIGVGPTDPATLPRASQRSQAAFFAGALGFRTLSDERQAMKAAMETAGPGFGLHATASSRDRLGPSAYAARLCDAVFAPSPGGNSPETIRLYDALECGAVPMVLKSRFVEAEGALAGPPFPVLDDWSQLGARVAELADGRAVDALQQATLAWWNAFKLAQQAKVRAAIDAVLA